MAQRLLNVLGLSALQNFFCTLDTITDSMGVLAQVVRKVLDMLLALIRALSKMNEPSGADLEGWESLVFHCRTLETSTNDLVAGIDRPSGMPEQQWCALADSHKSQGVCTSTFSRSYSV